MRETKINHRNLIVFYVLIYAVLYLVDGYSSQIQQALLSSSANIPFRILLATIGLVLALPVVYGLNRKSQVGTVLPSIGIRRRGILGSFLWANAFLLPLMIFLLVMVLAYGPESLLANSGVPLPAAPIPLWYPLFASTAWIIGGTVAFPVLQAYPYESLLDVPKKYAIPLIAVLWAGLYNASLLTGEFKPDDIIFFGFLFTVAYHKSRNSIGLVAAYVLAEAPLWYVVAATWGVAVYEGAIVARTFLGVISAGALLYWHYQSGKHA